VRFALASTLLAAATLLAGQDPSFRARIDLVNLGVTVTDKRGTLVTDLAMEDFAIFEDGKRQTVRYFAGADSPAPNLHLGLLLDVSGSMEDDIAFTRTASVRFLNTLTDAVDVTIVDFDTEVRVARYEQHDFARLIERIRASKTRGDTALFDAIGVYLDGAGGQDGRKIMLLYTDGGDTRSAMGLRDLLDLVKASDATIYAIGVLNNRSTTLRMEQQQVLRQIAEASGGQAFFPPLPRDLDRVYAQVVAEIRAQYTIGYLSANERADGRWRKVDVKVTRPNANDLRVRSRKGYYAPYRP
jgi:Ca-activated chloride channel homolog